MLLKKALLKAGVVTEAQVKALERQELSKKRGLAPKEGPKEHPKRRPPPPPVLREKKVPPPAPQEKKHTHHVRSLCDACGKTSPDVEYYRHTNRLLDKFWLCIKCADTHSIHDDVRQTAQSFHAITGVFRRQYGPTRDVKPLKSGVG